jgi:hypothetical protein
MAKEGKDKNDMNLNEFYSWLSDLHETYATEITGASMLMALLMIGFLVEKSGWWFRWSAEMRTLRRLYRENPEFPRNSSERQLLRVLIKKAALRKGGGVTKLPKNRYVAVKYIYLGLIPVLSSLHKFHRRTLRRSGKRRIKVLIQAGEEILNELSKKK